MAAGQVAVVCAGQEVVSTIGSAGCADSCNAGSSLHALAANVPLDVKLGNESFMVDLART